MRNSGELPSQERVRSLCTQSSYLHPPPPPPPPKERVYEGFVSVLNEVVLPSLSLLPCNCGVAEEVWSMVKQLPYEIRCVRIIIHFFMKHNPLLLALEQCLK